MKSLARSRVFISNPSGDPQDALAVLVADQVVPLDRHPVAVYLISLSPGSRRTQTAALRVIATLVSPTATELRRPVHIIARSWRVELRSSTPRETGAA